MKIKSLKFNNFASYSEMNISLDESITYFIGKNGSGKSTAGVTAIHAMFMGIAEKGNALIGERFRFIGPKAATANGEMVLHDEKLGVDILVKRKISKSGNEVSFEAPEGYEVSQKWLEDLFNVFLIAPKKFIELSSKAQATALGIDTSEFDNAIKVLKQEYTLINRDLTGIGNFEALEKVEKVDIVQLSNDKEEIVQFNDDQDKANFALLKADENITKYDGEVNVLKEQLKQLKLRISQGEEYVKKLKADKALLPKPKDLKPLDEINQKMQTANETNEKALAYTQFLEKKEKKDKFSADLQENKDKQAAKVKERTDYIKKQDLPFDNLEVSEDGELLLSGKPIKEPYFSTGELIKLVPILMASKHPELKYVFIQDFNLLDEDKQSEVEEYLVSEGMQLVIELVGTQKVNNKNSILLKDSIVVDSYEEPKAKKLL